jgi:hypothetical protein
VRRSTAFTELAREVFHRPGVGRLAEALGFDPGLEEVPREAWRAYGLTPDDVSAVLVAGRSGTAVALLLETLDTRGAPGREAARLARRLRTRNPARLFLLLVAGTGYGDVVLGTFGVGDTFRHVVLHRGQVRASDVDALAEMAPAGRETGLRLIARHARALDRSRITGRFFVDFRARRQAVAAAWTGLPPDVERERAQLALLFLSRLTFLYFLQSRGARGGSDRYMSELFGDWARDTDAGKVGTTFYRARLVPLFFGALNRRPEDRDAGARALGDLPYLNGGLFEPHSLERRFPGLDLPDPHARACLDDLLERYRFTTREAGAGAGYGVDPEILGRVFEGLMSPDRRSETGSFYTPAPVVDRVVREALACYVAGRCPGIDGDRVARGDTGSLSGPRQHRVRGVLERVRVLDPACGSGAFLLGALRRLETALTGVSDSPYGPVRREIVAGSLYGVDLLDDAALLCSLRLWLALSDERGPIRPLPNLDGRVRQGDALVDPLDLAGGPGGGPEGWNPLRDARVRRAIRAVAPAGRRYLDSGPDDRDRYRRALRGAELELARSWIAGLGRRRRFRLRELEALTGERDLFGEPSAAARSARVEAERVRARVQEIDGLATVLDEKGALPFFSFGVHFASPDGGFDMIVSNPPWIRAHRWPDHLRRLTRGFEVRRGGWAAAAELTGTPSAGGGQVDLSLLFAERAVRLLVPGGVLAVLLPAKFIRAIYGGSARRMLLRDLEFSWIEDHSLDQRSVFRAAAFVSVIVGRRATEPRPVDTGGPGHGTAVPRARVRLVRRGVEALEYAVAQRDLPLFPDDPASPWIMAPPEVVAVFRSMQAKGPPLGRHPDLKVRRGVMTGANDVLLLETVDPGLGGLSRIEATGHGRARRHGRDGRTAGRYRAVIETAAIRPVVRGADIDAFRHEVGGHLIWAPGVGGGGGPSPRLQRYLERHRARLERRSGWRSGMPLGALFRVSPATLESKVAWHDLSDTLRAVALPATTRFDGRERALVPLNTVYFIAGSDPDDALVLAGLLNSGPVRTLARAIAERAKDARFRFFAWTISSLPLPADWRGREETAAVRQLSAAAHAASGMGPSEQRALDHAVARLYGLDAPELAVVERFDRWLRGES